MRLKIIPQRERFGFIENIKKEEKSECGWRGEEECEQRENVGVN
jgi:hypothetical protein